MKPVIALLSALLLATAARADFQQPGQAAPDFTLKDTAGTEHSLSDFKGKWVVLEWVNYQCPFVKKHYKEGNMQGLQKKYTGKDVVWLSICSSAPGKQGHLSPADAAEAVKEHEAAPTAYLIDEDGTVGKLYDAKTTPHMIVINPEGTIVYNGAIDSIKSTKTDDVANAKNYVSSALDEGMAGDPVSVAQSQPYGCSVKY